MNIKHDRVTFVDSKGDVIGFAGIIDIEPDANEPEPDIEKIIASLKNIA